MIKYIIQRVLFSVPIIVLVSILFFFLIKMSPYDPVENELFIQGVDIKNDPNVSSSLYKKTYIELGLDKPVFYFDIVPNFYPDQIEEIASKPLKDAVYEGLKKSYRWKDIEQALKLYTQWTTSEKSCAEAKNVAFLSDLLPAACQSSLGEAYRQSLRKMKTNKANFFFPKIRFHGLDNQYHLFITQLFRGKAKRSKLDGKLVSGKIKHAAIWTVALVLPMLFLCFLLSMALGFYQAIHRNSWFDRISTYISYLFYVIPLFLLATLAIVFLSTKDYGSWTHWFPSVDIIFLSEKSPWSSVFKNLKFLILPLFIMLLHYIAILSRQMKTALLEEYKKPYITSLLSKGVSQQTLFFRHLLPNSLITMITIFTSMVPASLAGSLVIEELFNLPGLGRLLFRSLDLGDINVSLPLVLILSILTIISYLLGDVLNAYLNPKINLSSKTVGFE